MRGFRITAQKYGGELYYKRKQVVTKNFNHACRQYSKNHATCEIVSNVNKQLQSFKNGTHNFAKRFT